MLLASSLKTKRSSLGLSSLGTRGDGVYTHVVKYTVVCPPPRAPHCAPTPTTITALHLYSTVCANWSGGAWEIVEGRKGEGHFEF